MLLLLPLCLPLGGCSSAMIAAKEKLGYAKRAQLVDQVQAARGDQEEAKQQFATTLDELKSLTGYDGGDLEKTYTKLKRQLSRSESAADDVRGRIRSIERVSDALFREWEGELDQYSSATLRDASAQELRETKDRYGQLIGAMKNAESRMDPVLAAFRDQVLFLKHNLNARAIASLDQTVLELEGEVDRLIAEMNASIEEADSFIEAMGDG
ncbi:MAG: DUF2959 domain-containing protein [Phycisphaeraceae bacterium]|nr:MAG: DUF2959 domain-containing protein [Phycisphaeraceae bacterium]